MATPTPAPAVLDPTEPGERPIIEITGLSKSFPPRGGRGPVQALDDVSLTIEKGEFITILGPSGCGKTTLLRAIAGLTSWQEGRLEISGRPVDGPGPDRAVVFQDFALLPWLTVLKNIGFGLEMRGVGRASRLEIARDLLRTVGLEGFEDSHPHELSGGMQQRVGIARALAVDPDVLLMDEPFGALDEQTRRLLQEQLLSIMEDQKKTVVFVTHSIEEAVLLGDRIVLMSPRPGRIASIIDVPCGRPRASRVEEIEGSQPFIETASALWRQLRAMQPD